MRVAIVITVLLYCARPAVADEKAFKIIVHPDNTVTEIDRSTLRNAFLKKTTAWSNGRAFRPIGVTSKYPARSRFVVDVLKKTPAQLKSYWNQQIFSGKGIPPPESESLAKVVAYVLANQGAVAYVPASTDTGNAKVIQVD